MDKDDGEKQTADKVMHIERSDQLSVTRTMSSEIDKNVFRDRLKADLED